MRKVAGIALVTVLLIVAPAGAAFGQPVAKGSSSYTAAIAQVQAQENEDDSGGYGLWGLVGLLGLAGLMPKRKDRDRQPNTGNRM